MPRHSSWPLFGAAAVEGARRSRSASSRRRSLAWHVPYRTRGGATMATNC